MRPLLFVTLLAVGACAQAGKSGIQIRTDGGDVIPHPDAEGQHIDAFVNTIDAPPGMMTKTLTETASDSLQAASSIACGNSNQTQQNSYYRVFDLAGFGITTDFHVTQITFQVEDCESAAGNGQIVTVKVGTYNSSIGGSTLATGNMAMVAQNTNVQVPEVDETAAGTPGATVNAPITATIPAGSKLYAEVDATAGSTGSFFYIGSNTGTETVPSYFSASACTPPGTTPTSMASVKGSAASVLLTVTGTY
ncbi:MAG TPA: hypothetical protein VIV58_09750 [Kofleriaceae bacterium]